jgi:hypothetical protein
MGSLKRSISTSKANVYLPFGFRRLKRPDAMSLGGNLLNVVDGRELKANKPS